MTVCLKLMKVVHLFGVKGLTSFMLDHNGQDLWFEGFVVDDVVMNKLNMSVDIIAGAPFMELNDVSVRPSVRKIMLGDEYTFSYCIQASDNENASHECQLASGTVLELPYDADFDCNFVYNPDYDLNAKHSQSVECVYEDGECRDAVFNTDTEHSIHTSHA